MAKPQTTAPPTVTDVKPYAGQEIPKGGYTYIPVSCTALDSTGSAVWQVNFYIDPEGETVSAPSNRNKAAAGLSTFWAQEGGKFSGTLSLQNVQPGTHVFRVDAFDINKKLTRVQHEIVIT